MALELELAAAAVTVEVVFDRSGSGRRRMGSGYRTVR